MHNLVLLVLVGCGAFGSQLTVRVCAADEGTMATCCRATQQAAVVDLCCTPHAGEVASQTEDPCADDVGCCHWRMLTMESFQVTISHQQLPSCGPIRHQLPLSDLLAAPLASAEAATDGTPVAVRPGVPPDPHAWFGIFRT